MGGDTKKAGAIAAGTLAALGAFLTRSVDDCGRMAATGAARMGDDVAVMGARSADEAAGAAFPGGRLGGAALGDEAAFGGRRLAGAALADEAASGTLPSRLRVGLGDEASGRGAHFWEEVAIEGASHAPDVVGAALAGADGESLDDEAVMSSIPPAVVVLDMAPVAGADHHVTSFADLNVLRSTSPARLVIVATRDGLGPDRVRNPPTLSYRPVDELARFGAVLVLCDGSPGCLQRAVAAARATIDQGAPFPRRDPQFTVM